MLAVKLQNFSVKLPASYFGEVGDADLAVSACRQTLLWTSSQDILLVLPDRVSSAMGDCSTMSLSEISRETEAARSLGSLRNLCVHPARESNVSRGKFLCEAVDNFCGLLLPFKILIDFNFFLYIIIF